MPWPFLVKKNTFNTQEFASLVYKSFQEQQQRIFKDFLNGGSSASVSHSEAMQYYTKVGALADAIDTIKSKAISVLPVSDNKEVISTLDNPAPGVDYNSFMSQIVGSYLLTGNVYILAIGSTVSKPKELHVIPPQYVNVQDSGEYYVNASMMNSFMSGTYSLDSKTGRIFNGSLKELIHIKGYCTALRSQLNADSPLSSIKFDLDTIINAQIHNMMLLKNGASTGAMVNLKGADQETIESIRNKWNSEYTGAQNAGKIPFFGGDDIKLVNVGMNNKDLEIIESMEKSRRNIYSRFEIPLPLIDGDSQTYNNYATAQFALYDKAILPVLDLVFADLTRFFRARGVKIGEAITYDKSEIPALQLRFAETMKLKKDLEIFTINELRAEFGYDPIDGGESLYIPLAVQPLGTTIEGDSK